jgi:MYXO-CTERM domain-containing protein
MVFTIASESSHDQLIVGSVNLSNTNLSIDSFTDSSVTELAEGAGANFLSSGASFYKLIEGTTSGTMFANAEVMPAWEMSRYGLTGTQYILNTDAQRFWLAEGSIYAVAIPETSTTLLGATGLLALALRRRRSA